ncbi:BREX-1 system adenine-specific DNA-methyltransferase PglX [Reinekea forsetii]|uniref:site-specific DNA-methyltransferase (adenine-specific) n=1 Tax=Reinekea forsetii TaxID=1336806 RepID=A0A2K8KR62_9GAMM|nr:BREX-1 system adenine-specific DNA-methyltransferase PglX [Reinekea forsetii]ATX77102.1 putative type II restriction enzyme methylase subunit [Reinekea forsetii]
MNTANLKAYAPKARRDFIAAVSKQAQQFGVSAQTIHPVVVTGDICVVNGTPFPVSFAARITRLGERVERVGFAHTMEQVAYSWFNRIIAIRYMELHDYLGHGRRVLSHPDHPTGYQILDECTDISYGNSGETGQLPNLSHAQVVALKLDGTKDEELYRALLLAQCHALNTAMPFLFESVDDETELLLPENLTKTDSLIGDLITDIPESDWQNVEIIGWLYQFYISEKKDQVIGKVVKSEDIPAATQLFTPNWIVKYMVQNSLGAQWLATYPHSPLKAQMAYYIEPAEQTDEVNAQLKAITPTSLNPEELTLIDPASGSGHILVEAYELFKAIYLERGYRQRDVPQLILEKNLFGLDIDERAAQLTGFALMMKGRADDRRLFERGVKLNVMALVDSAGFDAEVVSQGLNLEPFGLTETDLNELKDLFEHATTFGSLIQVPEGLAGKLPALKQLSEARSQDLFVAEALRGLGPLVQQAQVLAAQYDAVVANPPYMGGKYLPLILRTYLKDCYPGYEKDFFSAFIDRDLAFSKPHGRLGFMSPFVWMFISSHEYLRTRLINEENITSLVQLEYSGFEGATVPICTFTLQKGHLSGLKGCYIRLSDFRGSQNQGPKTLEAVQNRACSWFFEAAQDEFKKIPGSPVAYWMSEAIRNIFTGTKMGEFFNTEGQNKTTNNERYLRYVWEVKKESIGPNKKWVICAKGGSFRKWAGNLENLIDWSLTTRTFYSKDHSARIIDSKFWYLEGITWTDITSASTAFRYLPSGCTYETAGPTLFVRHVKIFAVLAYLNSPFAAYAIDVLNPTMHVKVRDIRALPFDVSDEPLLDRVSRSAVGLVDSAMADWDAYERSWDFQFLPLLTISSEPVQSLESRYTSWIKSNRATIAEMQRLEEENNRLFIDAYGLADELTPDVPIEQITLTVNPAYRYGIKKSAEERDIRFREDTLQELISYAIGCMMGRYSLDAPGLIYAHSGNEGFDPTSYIKFPADDDGIIPLTDTEWYADDAANRLVEFISVAWEAAHLEANLDFLAANLSPKKGEGSRDTLRRYLCDSFYKDHMQTYKKRPIYWLFSSGKQKAFQCLVYLHRYNAGTLARMRTEYVIPLTAKLSSHIDKLDNDKLASSSAAEIKKLEKEIQRLQKQQTELTEFDEKLKHLADQRITLDLDDGVKVNYGKFGDLLVDVKAIHGEKAK